MVDIDELKNMIRKLVVERLGEDFFSAQDKTKEHRLHKLIEELIAELTQKGKMEILPTIEQKRITEELLNEILGLGPLQPLLQDKTISEILINGPQYVFIEREGMISSTDVKFRSEEHLFGFIERVLSLLGRRISELEPFVDARLQDGTRVNIVIPPVSLSGTLVSMHKSTRAFFTADDLVGYKTLSREMAKFLESAVKARLNIILSGGTSVGKTTTLNMLSSFIPDKERIITIEDIAELQLHSPHTLRLEARPANIQGRGEITIRQLFKNTLHMRPDRIIIGEVRGEEVLDMLQAMNTGHDGSMTTIHANSPYDALTRLEMMALMGGVNITESLVKRQIISALDIVIQQRRFDDGSRRITHICEIVKTKGSEYKLNDLFIFDEDKKEFARIDTAPQFYNKIKKAGFTSDAWERNING